MSFKKPDEAQLKARAEREARFMHAFQRVMPRPSPEMLGVKEETMRHWIGGRYVPSEAVMILLTFYKTMGPEAYMAVWRLHQKAAKKAAAAAA